MAIVGTTNPVQSTGQIGEMDSHVSADEVTLCEWLGGFICRFGILGSMYYQGVGEIRNTRGGWV